MASFAAVCRRDCSQANSCIGDVVTGMLERLFPWNHPDQDLFDWIKPGSVDERIDARVEKCAEQRHVVAVDKLSAHDDDWR